MQSSVDRLAILPGSECYTKESLVDWKLKFKISINYVDKQGEVGVAEMSTILHKLVNGGGSKILKTLL